MQFNSDLNLLREDTGAKIRINDDGTKITINGTYGQCEVAKSRIEVYLDDEANKPRPGVYPELGFTILDASVVADKSICSRYSPKIHFRRYDLKDNNAHSKGKELFYVMFDNDDSSKINLEINKTVKEEFEFDCTETSSSNADVYDLLFNNLKSNQNILRMKTNTNNESDHRDAKELDESRYEWEPTVLTPLNPFGIFSQLPQCITQITSYLSELFPVSDPGMEIRVSLYLGQELFFNIPPSEPSSFTLSEWCRLKRLGIKGIKTSFQHDVPLVDGLRILQADPEFQEKVEGFGDCEKDKWSISIYFNDGEDKKMKLNWDYQKKTWKITKIVKLMRRVILLDLVSGSYFPDIRLLVKTQFRIPIDQKLETLITALQNSINRSESYLSFRVKDFAGILNVTRIEQTINKRRFFNKNYRINLVPTKKDFDGTRVTFANSVIIKHLNWIMMNKYQTQSYENSLKNKSSQLSSSPYFILSRSSSSSIQSSQSPISYEQSNTYNTINEQFDLISFDDEPPLVNFSPISSDYSNLNIKTKTRHLLDEDIPSGTNLLQKSLLDDSSTGFKSRRHILYDDYDLFSIRNSTILQNDYNKNEYGKEVRNNKKLKNGELQNYEDVGGFVEERNWKDILELTIPSSLEYTRKFSRIVS
ncbi:13087_t:CDS:2 [Funneliformis mosseae]|uniref:13087_t:CDS:1 n=1 Tax=Funneliformis mosseae TaxID=27381 RepID=A0A9N9HCU4_FUNMO|nr:13087_t:CDS:2 [Funneliformis mosseae]